MSAEVNPANKQRLAELKDRHPAVIAEIRGIPEGVDCASPSRHTVFHDVDSMLDLVETIADRTGLPVGIKSAVGDMDFWEDLAAAMADGERGVEENPKSGGGHTGASSPRSAPSNDPAASVIACTSVAVPTVERALAPIRS